MQKERHPSDPRKDLVSDHRHWEEVLYNCWHEERDLYCLLHGLRCGGAELVLTHKSYRLMPGEWNETEWNGDIKNRLNPFRDKLVGVFKLTRIGRITDEKLPDGIFKIEQGRIFA